MDEARIHQQWLEGYGNRLTWPDTWESHAEPGGPLIFGSSRYTKAGKAEYDQSIAENKAWRDGWRKGHAEKVRTGRSNPGSTPQ